MARIEFTERVTPVDPPFAIALLDFDERQKVRNLVTTTSGDAVGVFIERGTSLKHGDHLRSKEGLVLRIEAAPEPLSVVRSSDARSLVRAAYHLGNRHMRLEIGVDYVAYQTDYVLDDMIRNLGFEIISEKRAFEPESGAYSRGEHDGAHGHSHGHGILKHGGHGGAGHGHAHGPRHKHSHA